jgi:hypothetical protein
MNTQFALNNNTHIFGLFILVLNIKMERIEIYFEELNSKNIEESEELIVKCFSAKEKNDSPPLAHLCDVKDFEMRSLLEKNRELFLKDKISSVALDKKSHRVVGCRLAHNY